MVAYWLGALAASVLGLAEMPALPTDVAIRGGAIMLALVLCSLVAAGGSRNLARTLRATLR
jgi:hypothetical protein